MRNEPLGPVVVGVDGSAASMAAVELAAEEAASRIVSLLIVHAAGEPPADRVRRLLDVAVSEALANHPGISVSAEVLTGTPMQVLVERSRGASLVVLGHRPNGVTDRGGRMNSVAQQVAQRATVPVMIRRPLDNTAPTVDEPWPVLVAVAGRPCDDQVVEFAFREAALRGAPLRALHIWATGQTGWSTAHHGFVEARDAADQMLVDALTPWSEKYPEVTVHRIVRHGLDIPVALVAASRSAQLIVVGSSRRDRARQIRPWAVEALIQRACCSLAVVPAA